MDIKLHSIKLAQTLPGTSSNIINNDGKNYALAHGKGGWFEVDVLRGKDEDSLFWVYPANIAYVKFIKVKGESKATK